MHPWWSWNRERERIRSAHGTSISVKKRKGRKVTAVVVAGGPGPGGTPPARGSSAKYLPTSRQRKSTPRCHLAMQGGKKVHRGSDVCMLGTSSCSLGRKRSSSATRSQISCAQRLTSVSTSRAAAAVPAGPGTQRPPISAYVRCAQSLLRSYPLLLSTCMEMERPGLHETGKRPLRQLSVGGATDCGT